MLIEFKVENFRSFKKTQVFSMVAGSLQEHRKTNTQQAKLPGFDRILRAAVVYGPNAAGKTNLLRAMQFMKNFVVSSAGTTPGTPPPHTPFRLSKATAKAPSEFQITFAQDETRYDYGFSVNGQRVCKEWLVEYATQRGRMLFERVYDDKTEEYRWKLSDFLKGKRSVWTQSTRPEELFLSKAIQLNNTQLLPVFAWFQKRLVIIVGPSLLNRALTLKLLDTADGKTKLLPFLRAADFGIDGVDVQREQLQLGAQVQLNAQFFERKDATSIPNQIKISFAHKSDENEDVLFDFADESSGTQRLFDAAGPWLNVFANGEVLLFDELDTSLHPKLARFLVEQFHSNKINNNNAQLVCTTHDTSLLDQDIFRRDQFWFVEKQKESDSNLYPLTDFKPRGDEVIERWYMRGKYGAVPVLAPIEE